MERDTGNLFLTQAAVCASDEDPSNQLFGSSITYRIAVGPQQGRKVFTLQTLPTLGEDPVVIHKILVYLDEKGAFSANGLLPDCRASPSLPVGLFD